MKIQQQNKIIEVLRGQNVVLGFKLKHYKMREGDVITFTLGKRYETLISKELNNNILELAAAETAALEQDTYQYDVSIAFATGERKYIVPPTDFVVKGVNA